MAKSTLTGDAALLRAMKGIPDLTARQLDGVVRESLDPMKTQAKSNAMRNRQPGPTPRGGHLDQGIVTRKVDGRGKTYREFWLGLTRRARFIGHLLEFGVRPHIQPNRLNGGLHPGHRAFPFMTPAFESKKGETTRLLGQKTWGAISRAALMFGRRAK